MNCANCQDKIDGKPIRQGEEYYCSLECANLASGIEPADEEDGYFEEAEIEGLYEEEE